MTISAKRAILREKRRANLLQLDVDGGVENSRIVRLRGRQVNVLESVGRDSIPELLVQRPFPLLWRDLTQIDDLVKNFSAGLFEEFRPVQLPQTRKSIFPFRLQIKSRGFEGVRLLLHGLLDHLPEALGYGERQVLRRHLMRLQHSVVEETRLAKE